MQPSKTFEPDQRQPEPDAAPRLEGRPVIEVDSNGTRINTRLALLAAMTRAKGDALYSSQDLFKFQPPAEPPKLQKPNRRSRRAVLARKRKG